MRPHLLAVPALILLLGVGFAAGNLPASAFFDNLLLADQPLGFSFTYQGFLSDGANPADGLYDFNFRLYDSLAGGLQVGSQVNFPDLDVNDGYFTAELDFGAFPFNGQKLWLEIDARPDGSGTFETLSPRIQLTAAPYALFSLNSDKLDGQDGAYFQREITQECAQFQAIRRVEDDGTVVCESSLQRRVTGTCTSGEKITAIAADGTVTCLPDLDSGGSYTNGFGLLLSGNTFSVDTSIIQQRVGAGCAVGSTIRQINPDGKVECWSDGPLNRALPPIENALSTGFGRIVLENVNQVTIGADGLPLILFATTDEYRMAHCADPACLLVDNITPISRYSGGPPQGSLAIDSSEVGIFIFFEPTGGTIEFGRCTDVRCTTFLSGQLGNGVTGSQPDLAIGPDGLPLVAYWDQQGEELRLFRCLDSTCSAGADVLIDLPAQPPLLVDPHPSLAIGADGLPLIAYHYSPSRDLRLAHCSDRLCSSVTYWTVFSQPADGFTPSLTIGKDGLGLVAYVADDPQRIPAVLDLMTAHCGNGSCSSGTSAKLVPLSGPSPTDSRPTITGATPGLGVLQIADISSSTIKIGTCNNLECSSATFSSAIQGGSPSSLTISPSGNPLVSYLNPSGFLETTLCGSWFCVPYLRYR